MGMSRDDYSEIADAIQEAKRVIKHNPAERPQWERGALEALEIATRELATACARRRKTGAGSFNRAKFVEACGFSEA